MSSFPFRVIDLTHTLSPAIPTWDGRSAFQLENEEGISMYTSSGTHIDAPAMQTSLGKDQGGISISDLPLDCLCVPVHVIDISKKAKAEYQVTTVDIQEYENRFGKILEESLVIFHTGWGLRWAQPEDYCNRNAQGTPLFPTCSLKAAEYLLERNIVGLGTDAFSPDPFDSDFPVHILFFRKGKYLIENLANTSLLPPQGAYVIALPLKFSGQEAPARVIGLIPQTNT